MKTNLSLIVEATLLYLLSMIRIGVKHLLLAKIVLGVMKSHLPR
jgi:hypothetical protein